MDIFNIRKRHCRSNYIETADPLIVRHRFDFTMCLGCYISALDMRVKIARGAAKRSVRLRDRVTANRTWISYIAWDWLDIPSSKELNIERCRRVKIVGYPSSQIFHPLPWVMISVHGVQTFTVCRR